MGFGFEINEKFEFEILEGSELILRTYLPHKAIFMSEEEIKEKMLSGEKAFRDMLTRKGLWSKNKGYIFPVFESYNNYEEGEGFISEYHIIPVTPANKLHQNFILN